MSWLHSLLNTTILATGIGIVVWWVSMMTGDNDYLMSGILIAVFFVAWFWIHRGMNDPEL